MKEVANLPLQLSPESDSGNVAGRVQRPDGTAIPIATVKLFDSAGNPFEHNNSNNAGNFIFPRVPVGSYFITASEPGFLIPVRIPISVQRNRTTSVTITMQPDPDATTNVIFGIVRIGVGGPPVEDATVELFQVTGTTPIMIGIVSSNTAGQYVFANLPNGEYFVTASKPGFLSEQSAPVTVENREFAPLDINLIVDPDANTGTISGIVTDSTTGQPIANATVALYSVVNNTETVIDITKSNAGGLYLFGDLPTGTYRVKATVQVEG